jgi:hypothetical protein
MKMRWWADKFYHNGHGLLIEIRFLSWVIYLQDRRFHGGDKWEYMYVYPNRYLYYRYSFHWLFAALYMMSKL